MNKSTTTRYFEDIDNIPRDYELEYAYNFLTTFHTLKPEFVKGTCWEDLHWEARLHRKAMVESFYLLWLAEQICEISNEKDFVGLYKKYTDRVE